MPRPRKAAFDPLSDLQRKTAILEREMTAQRAAMDRLKEITVPRPHQPHALPGQPRNGRLAR
jgi:hypothetical protein